MTGSPLGTVQGMWEGILASVCCTLFLSVFTEVPVSQVSVSEALLSCSDCQSWIPYTKGRKTCYLPREQRPASKVECAGKGWAAPEGGPPAS